jgi:ubiquinone/menaquinone biosynthesis C-methylase UbiE
MNTSEQIGAEPHGPVGRLAGMLMNAVHKRQYAEVIAHIREAAGEDPASILDLGCGGGIAIKLFADMFPRAQVTGVDCSRDMVDLALRTNRKAVQENRVRVLHQWVESMDLPANSMDIITVFDTINFWEHMDAAFMEVHRVLKDSGKLFIINGYPEPGTRWHEFVKFKNDDQYREFLSAHGFSTEETILRNRTIVLQAAKS